MTPSPDAQHPRSTQQHSSPHGHQDHPQRPSRREGGLSRRGFLFGGGALGLGAAAALGTDRLLGRTDAAGREAAPDSSLDTAGRNGQETIAFHGPHQAGIETPPQTHALFLGLDLRPEVDREGLGRLMRILTDDARRLTQGRAALADTEPEMASLPARLTVTFGFGPGFVERAGGEGPSWLRPLPPFEIDALEERFSDGDLLVHVGSDDPTALAHAVRMLSKDARAFTTVRWSQPGFRHAYGTHPQGVTMRNLFGQVDGTVNPSPGTEDFASVVWCRDAGWMTGGTGLVIRRIHMDLDTWDEVDRVARDSALGRRQDDGGPITGGGEFDDPDFEATTELGLPVIPAHAHIRRARTEDPDAHRMFRRGYNYDAPPAPGSGSVSDSGLLFVAYQADVDRQFVPVQQSLADLDLFNLWTTPVGSAVFAVPPGCSEGGFIGEGLLA